MKTFNTVFLILISGILFSCNKTVKIASGDLSLTFDDMLRTSVTSTAKGAKPLMDGYAESEILITKKTALKLFRLKDIEKQAFENRQGKGTKTILKGIYQNDGYCVEKIVAVTSYDTFPGLLSIHVSYINRGEKELTVTQWMNENYPVKCTTDTPCFWSFQGSSTSERNDWILPVNPGFSQKNYMGMNNTDYGGGIPVVDLWRRDVGIMIGHTEMVPKLVSLPLEMDPYDDYATIGVSYSYDEPIVLKKGDTLETYNTFVAVHTGDCFSALEQYSLFMQTKGISLAEPEPEAYEAVWCAWGYERNFTADEITGTLPKVKELGIKWVDIDDGYQIAEGDWDVNPVKFPGGDKDMRKLVDKIHACGMKAKLWWNPLAVDPTSRLLKEHPDILLYNRDWAPQFISWWDSYYMSPSSAVTIKHTKDVLDLFLVKWDFDGLKMDGQNMNCIPPDYNPHSDLSSPLEAPEKLPEFYKMIYQTARSLKPNAVVQFCPCGCVVSFYNLPYMNQAVASDPESSKQTRMKGKIYKALIGNRPYYGDHVELSDGGDDFASQFGIGAVPGTKFTWPKNNPDVREDYLLTPQKEKEWKKWIRLYNAKKLSLGDYIGTLYDFGYDIPEAHVIQKGDTLFYGFYQKEWNGDIDLRGLKVGINYHVVDYFNNTDYGLLQSSNARIKVHFHKYLLLQAYPAR
jgi:alpha-galactosidase